MKIIKYALILTIFVQKNCYAQIVENDSFYQDADSLCIIKKADFDILHKSINYYSEQSDAILNKFQKWKIKKKFGVNIVTTFSENISIQRKMIFYNEIIKEKKFHCKKDWEEKLIFKVYIYTLRNIMIHEKDFKEFDFFERINWRYLNIHSFNYTNYNLNN